MTKKRAHSASPVLNKGILSHTIKELELAFDTWETLTDAKALSPDQKGPATSKTVKPTENLTAAEQELRRKTRELLDRLREQLDVFSEEDAT